MYKKISLAALSLVLLAGCANETAKEPAADDTGTKDIANETMKGTSQYDNGGIVNATVEKEGDNLSNVMIEFVDKDGNAITGLTKTPRPVSTRNGWIKSTILKTTSRSMALIRLPWMKTENQPTTI